MSITCILVILSCLFAFTQAFFLPQCISCKAANNIKHWDRQFTLDAAKAKEVHFSSSIRPIPTSIVDEVTLNAKTRTDVETSFVVYGEPMPLQRHRVLRSGISYNPSSKLQSEFLDACKTALPDKPLEGPLEVRMVFYFKRPLNHYGTGKKKSVLKSGMDIWHSKRKDVDNLAKFVLDAINKKAYLDDGQVSILSTAKLYTEENPRIVVKIRKLAADDTMFAENFDNAL